jgi:hypothetical protein
MITRSVHRERTRRKQSKANQRGQHWPGGGGGGGGPPGGGTHTNSTSGGNGTTSGMWCLLLLFYFLDLFWMNWNLFLSFKYSYTLEVICGLSFSFFLMLLRWMQGLHFRQLLYHLNTKTGLRWWQFWEWILLYTWVAWATILLFVFPHVSGMTGVCHHAQVLLDMGSQELFSQAGLEPNLASLVARITGLSQCT